MGLEAETGGRMEKFCFAVVNKSHELKVFLQKVQKCPMHPQKNPVYICKKALYFCHRAPCISAKRALYIYTKEP